MTRTLTDDRVTAIARTLTSGRNRADKLATLQTEHGLTETAARRALRVAECSTPEGRRVYEAAEDFAARVNAAESDLAKASTADLAIAIAARVRADLTHRIGG